MLIIYYFCAFLSRWVRINNTYECDTVDVNNQLSSPLFINVSLIFNTENLPSFLQIYFK